MKKILLLLVDWDKQIAKFYSQRMLLLGIFLSLATWQNPVYLYFVAKTFLISFLCGSLVKRFFNRRAITIDYVWLSLLLGFVLPLSLSIWALIFYCLLFFIFIENFQKGSFFVWLNPLLFLLALVFINDPERFVSATTTTPTLFHLYLSDLLNFVFFQGQAVVGTSLGQSLFPSSVATLSELFPLVNFLLLLFIHPKKNSAAQVLLITLGILSFMYILWFLFIQKIPLLVPIWGHPLWFFLLFCDNHVFFGYQKHPISYGFLAAISFFTLRQIFPIPFVSTLLSLFILHFSAIMIDKTGKITGKNP